MYKCLYVLQICTCAQLDQAWRSSQPMDFLYMISDRILRCLLIFPCAPPRSVPVSVFSRHVEYIAPVRRRRLAVTVIWIDSRYHELDIDILIN